MDQYRYVKRHPDAAKWSSGISSVRHEFEISGHDAYFLVAQLNDLER